LEHGHLVAFCPLSTTPVFDLQGDLAPGAKIYVYDASTNTPRAAYTTSAVGTQHARPIVVPASGRVPAIWIVGNPYKVRITTSAGVLIDEIDGLPADSAVDEEAGTPDTAVSVGALMPFWQSGTIAGWVRANGRTMGNASSGGAERANDDTEDLFEYLWNADSVLAVSGGRGANAAADFAANKTITLPDLRFRAPIGADDMGNSAAGRTTDGLFATGNGTTVGSYGGLAGHTLLTAEMTTHTHTGTISSSGAHTHSGTTGNQSANHTHSFTPAGTIAITTQPTVSITDPGHQHTYNTAASKTANGAVGASQWWFGADSSTLSGAQFTGITAALANGTYTFSGTPGTTGQTSQDHNHTFSISSSGAHTHTFTTDTRGGSGAHNNMSPFAVVTWYLRL
jgi:microcystin-dependent protein